MALQNSGTISAADINNELGRSSSSFFSMGGSEERSLAGVGSGAISLSDFHGASDVLYEGTLTVGFKDASYSNRYGWESGSYGELTGGHVLSNGYTLSGISKWSTDSNFTMTFEYNGTDKAIPFNYLDIDGEKFYKANANETFVEDPAFIANNPYIVYGWPGDAIGKNTGEAKSIVIN